MNDVLIVGGGVAGLACAQALAAGGLRPLVLEGSDRVGGRARTDEHDGFRLDRGFHLFSPGALDARLALDYARLDLRPLARGALVRHDGRFRHAAELTADPHRWSPTGTALARREAAAELRVSSPHEDGQAALPARGIGAVAQQLAERLDVRAGAIVSAVGPGVVVLADGERLRAHAVVVAAAGLVDDAPDGWHALSCSWFDAPQPPLPGAWLVLGDGDGPITTLCSVSEVAPEYAPPGRALVAVATASGRPDAIGIGEQLARWFGREVRAWRHLRSHVVPSALPARPAGAPLTRPARLARGLYACGDHRERPSLPGALASGRRAAEAVLLDLT